MQRKIIKNEVKPESEEGWEEKGEGVKSEEPSRCAQHDSFSITG
jgi:hypothetical protein